MPCDIIKRIIVKQIFHNENVPTFNFILNLLLNDKSFNSKLNFILSGFSGIW